VQVLTDIISDGNGDIGVIVIDGNIMVSAIINVNVDIVADMKVSLGSNTKAQIWPRFGAALLDWKLKSRSWILDSNS